MSAFGTVPARSAIAASSAPRADAVTMLSIYLVLLFAIPSSMTVTALGSLGRPAMWWGLALLLWWILDHLQRSHDRVVVIQQPVRVAIFGFLAITFLSYGWALLRGQPADQVSPATVSLINVLSLSGVGLVALDGISTMGRFRALVGWLVLGGGLLATLGLAQFATGRAFVDLISIPGMSSPGLGVQSRAAFVRASATATHPLEYAAVLSCCLPLAIAVALDHAVSRTLRNLAWLAVLVLAVAEALSVSRSALLGMAVSIALIIPALPQRTKRLFAVMGPIVAAGIAFLVPGMFSTMLHMFTGISSDSSAQSRTNGLSAGIHFIGHSPAVGLGFGTLLPRYFIFDDEWLGIAVQLGLIGLVIFGGIFAAGIWSANSVRRRAPKDSGAALYGQALIAACASVAVLSAGFDSLSFPQAAALVFLVPALGAALRSIHADTFQVSRRPIGPHRRAVVAR